MGLTFAIIAAVLAAISNLLVRMSIVAGGNSRAHLTVQLFTSFLIMILLNPMKAHNFHFHLPTLSLGLLGGLILGFFFWSFGKTMERGPASLSIAVLNTTTIVPPILMALFFGFAYGHPFTGLHATGFFLVVIGIFWAGWSLDGMENRRAWMQFALFMFLCHTLFLVFLQWWAMVLNPALPLSRLLPMHITTANIQWFMPAIFFVAWLFQLAMFLSSGHRVISPKEFIYGFLGGAFNGVCSYFLILAPQVATPFENALIFPTFSVGIILFCNMWAQGIYSEKINWKACALCILGLLIGTISFT